MTTPYCSKNQFAHRKGYTDWAAYVLAGFKYPDPEELDDALEDATDIMNDEEHIGCLSTNIDDTDYTQRLERICFNMANRILDVEKQRAGQGFTFTFSPQDFLYAQERKVLINLSIKKGYRVGMGVGIG